MNHIANRGRRGLLLSSLAGMSGLLRAQPKILKLVVPFPAGGVTDQVARILADKMGQRLGQTIINDNRPGAGGRIGIEAVIKAPADEATLLFTNSSYSILPVIDPKVPFDPETALVPISMTGLYSLQIVVRAGLPVSTLEQFVEYAKQNPGKLTFGSAGLGSGAHFAGEYFKAVTGTSLVHVPYKSTSAALNDVAAGLIDMTYDASTKPFVDSGRVKILAVMGDKPDPRFPGSPTVGQAGFPELATQSWVGMLAPVGTPQPLLERLHEAASFAVTDPAVQQRLAELGVQYQGGPASRLGTMIEQEVVLYRGIASRAKLQFE